MTARILSVLTLLLVCASLSSAQTTASDFYSSGMSKMAIKNYEGAIADLTKAIAMNYPALGEVYVVRGVAKKRKMDLRGAWDDATESIRFLDNPAVGYALRGEIEYARNDLDASITDFSKAVIADPTNSRLYRQRAEVRKENGDLDGAIADLTKAIELKPSHESYVDRGSIYHASGAKQRAFADFEKAVQLSPRNVEVYFNRANAHFLDKNYDLAAADLRKASAISPKSTDVHHLFGHVLIEKGDIASATAAFTKAIELAPRVAHYYVDRAVTASRDDNHQTAIDDISKAIELDPKGSAYYRMRAWTYLYLGNNEAVYGDAATALKLSGLKDHGAYSVMSGYIALLKTGKAEGAREFLTTWIGKADEKDWSTSVMKYLSGQMTSAHLLQTATDQGELTEAHTFIGEIALINGKVETAKTHFEWVRDNGSSVSVQFPLAITELKKLGAPATSSVGQLANKK